jgi:hypothetical protein
MDPQDQHQYDVLEGPFTKSFHVFFKRRLLTRQKPKPYPWFIGGIHRAARQLDVADPWELITLAVAPFLFALVYKMWRWGVSPTIVGYCIIGLGCYVGFYLVLWVFLDRRLDYLDQSRVMSIRRKRLEARDERLMRRRDAKMSREARIAANAEAAKRGEQKAGRTFPGASLPSAAASRPAQVSLDDLLDHH